jgi:hypothetical protein
VLIILYFIHILTFECRFLFYGGVAIFFIIIILIIFYLKGDCYDIIISFVLFCALFILVFNWSIDGNEEVSFLGLEESFL